MQSTTITEAHLGQILTLSVRAVCAALNGNHFWLGSTAAEAALASGKFPASDVPAVSTRQPVMQAIQHDCVSLLQSCTPNGMPRQGAVTNCG
jgi:hypothetical protein